MRCARTQSVVIVLCAAGLIGALGFALYHQVLLVNAFHELWRVHDAALPAPQQSASHLSAHAGQLAAQGADLRILMAAFTSLLASVVALSMTWQRRQRLRDLISCASRGDWWKVRATPHETWWPEALVLASVLPAPIASAVVLHLARSRSLDLIRGMTGEPAEREAVDRVGELVAVQWNALLSGASASLAICLVAAATLALALSWRLRLRGILQAALSATSQQNPGSQPYRSWQDDKQALAWLRHPGPSPVFNAALAVAAWTTIALPASVGVILFASGAPSCHDPKGYEVCRIERLITDTQDLIAWLLVGGGGLTALTIVILAVSLRSPQSRARRTIAPDIAAAPLLPRATAALLASGLATAALASIGVTIPACAQNSVSSWGYPQREPMDSAGFVLDGSLLSGPDSEVVLPRSQTRLLLSTQGVRWNDRILTIESAAERVPREMYGSRLWIRCRADVPLDEVDRLLRGLQDKNLQARVYLTVVRMPRYDEPAFGDIPVPRILWRRFDVGNGIGLFLRVEGKCETGQDIDCRGDEAQLDAMVERSQEGQSREQATRPFMATWQSWSDASALELADWSLRPSSDRL